MALFFRRWRARGPRHELFTHGPQLPDFIEFIVRPLYRDKSFLTQKYVAEGLSIAQIAEQISSSKEAVRYGLRRAGIKVREAHKPYRRQSQSRFGRRRTKGIEIDHQAEQRTIATVKRMRAGGMSLREIATCLTKMGILTKNGATIWHPQMVKRLLAFQQ